jgi:hypothetical protein
MKYNQPYGVSDPNAAYINGNPSTGQMGSIPPAESIEYPQREIVNVITESGLTPDNADLTQLSKAIQSGRVNYGIDAGTVNALNVTLTPAPATLLDGFIMVVRTSTTNTGDTVMIVNGGTARRVMRRGGLMLLANDLRANEDVLMIFNAFFNGWLLYPAGWNEGGGQLVTNMDLYVNGPIGNDANDGTDNTAAHAFKTITRAVNSAFNYAPSGKFGVNIHIANGTYPESVFTPTYGGPTLNIIGNTTTPNSVLVSGGTINGVPSSTLGVLGPNTMNVSGICVQTVTSPTNRLAGFFAGNGATMSTANTASLNCQGPVFEGFSAGTINLNGNHTFEGNSDELLLAFSGGNFYTPYYPTPPQFTIASPITVAIGTAVAYNCGVILIQNGGASWVNGSNVTGPRYSCVRNAIIDTQTANANYFPGTVAGTVAQGGQYN